MASLTEDELLDALTWSEDSYTLAEFITEFPLPQVVQVVRGYDGGTDSSTLGYGEVLTLHALRETRILVAEDKNGNTISVGLDYPDEFQILPQTKDCSLNSCGVTDLVSFYQTVKYLEVIQAHYGTGDNLDSTASGELLEILDITKPHKPEKAKVQVRNLESDQKSTLTSTCTATFRRLLDWKKYKAPELKTHQYGFPVRVRFLENEVGKDTEYQRLISKSPDINVTNETDDITVITTTVSSATDFKFCFEIPGDLEIKVAVAEGFSNGAKHYTDIVNNLNERFDVTKFMASHQPALIKRRDAIKQYDYKTIKGYIIDKSISSPKFGEVEQDRDAPALPPRVHTNVKESKSLDIPPTPPKVPEKPVPSVETKPQKPKPVVPPRERSASQNLIDEIKSKSGGKDNTPTTSSTDIPQPTKNNLNSPSQIESKVPQTSNNNPNDPTPQKMKVSKQPVMPPINTPASSPTVLPTTNNDPNDPPQTELKNSKQPVEFLKNAPDVVQTINNKPISPLLAELKTRMKVPVPPPRLQQQDKNSKPQANKTDETSQATSKNSPSPANVHGGTDGPAVTTTQTTSSQPKSPSQADEKDNPKSEPPVPSPQLPPRNRRPKLDDTSNNSQGNNTDEKLPTNGHPEKKDRQIVKDKREGNYAPDLPPKSREPHYVTPILPNVLSDLPQSVVLPELPSTPPPTRNPPFRRGKKRADTLPREFKIGENIQNAVSQEDEGVYEIPFQNPKVMPVAPQMNVTTPQYGHEEDPYELVAKIPLDLSGLSVGEVSNMLKNLNMGEYAESFENHMIDGNLLQELKESQLIDLEMTSFHRTKLLNFINGWRPKLVANKHKT